MYRNNIFVLHPFPPSQFIPPLAGIYTCQATNELGTVDHDVELKQVHKPGPITAAVVSASFLHSLNYFGF